MLKKLMIANIISYDIILYYIVLHYINLKMDTFKKTYKNEHITFVKNFCYAKKDTILSNYTKKLNAGTLRKLTTICIIIPNSIKYVDKHITICNNFYFEPTNNLKCIENSCDNSKINMFKYDIHNNSFRTKKYYGNLLHNNLLNTIFHNSLKSNNNNKHFKNIFLLENIRNFHLYCNNDKANNNYNINICSNRKIIIFKNANITYFVECLYDLNNYDSNNLAMFRNIHNICLSNEDYESNFDISKLCNVYEIQIESCYYLLKINKLTKNNTLIINYLCQKYICELAFNCMYFTQFVICNNDLLDKMCLTGTVRILCLSKHCLKLNKTTNKYVDYLLKY